MKKLLSLTSIGLAALLLATSVFTACAKAPDGDWRDEVTSVLSQVDASKPNVTHPLPSTDNTTTDTQREPSSGRKPIRPEYTNPNAGKSHPITNADANEVPTVSYGNTLQLVYGNKVYFSYHDDETGMQVWHSVDLLNMNSYDPQITNKYSQVIASRATPLCMNPFCQHKEYSKNNGFICPLYFKTHRDDSVKDYLPIYCIDYTESNGGAPVFYILAAEPEYKVVGEQVIKNTADDYAIYRYDTAVGEREIIAENLPGYPETLTICGEYIYYYSFNGLTAINKKGKTVGTSDTAVYILGYENGVLYLSDLMGKVYTAKKDLSNLKEVFTVDTSDMSDKLLSSMLKSPITPFGYQISEGYLYYVDDPEVFWQSEKLDYSFHYTTSIYRIPINDLSAEPERVLESQCLDGEFYGIAGGKLYYIPPINYWGDSTKDYVYSFCLAYVDLTTKETKVMEEFAFDMPEHGVNQRQAHVITSELLVGLSRQYNIANSYIVLYHFETGDIMYISKSSMYGKVPLPE